MRHDHGYSGAKLPLYFEWHGKSPSSQPPLLLVHGGGSTIESNWGRLIPALESSRRMLAVELQGHGRTGSGDQAASFEDSADGVAALLRELGAAPVDVLGLSNGGQVGMQLAIRHPRLVRRLIVASAPFRRDGMVDGFWDGLAGATYADLPEPYREADLAVSGDPAHAERMFHLDRELMLTGFADWPDSLVASITAPTLVVAGDRDVIRTEHAVLLASLIPDARLLIVPGNHGDYLGELAAAAGDPGPVRRTLPFLVRFLDQPEPHAVEAAVPEQLVSDADHVALSRLVAEISWRIDHGRADTVWELFVPDGVLDTGGTPLAGHEAIREWGRSRVASTVRTRHIVSGIRFIARGNDQATGSCLLTVFMHDGAGRGPAVPAVVGEDADEFIRTDVGWRFVSRTFETLFA